ncbi:hypothetical protein AA0111_g7852 [Alternaria arborescens]|uniref:hypothetical protein n=1 Tax=Alternaria arborescens TaxID=156630 RepID=UPI001074C673|nr:hypothetical protein AA0111_g7852 [Alternaria arborescens]RYO26794.1 hypothetical protein AA0111_g7852 [Alternaria arborescens]
MVLTCPRFDSPSLFGRDIHTFNKFVRTWYGDCIDSQDRSDRPWRIVYPVDYLPVRNNEQALVFDDFVGDLAAYLNVEPEILSIAETWRKTPPVEEGDILKFMENTQVHGFFYELYHHFDEFREDYRRKYDREPFLSMPLKWVWRNLGRLVDESQKNRAFERYSVYKDWFLKHILRPEETRTIVVLPIEELEPRYRDIPPVLPIEAPKGINVLYLSPILGAPEIVVPAGQISFRSRITEHEEYLPVAVSLLGAPETDLELTEMTEDFLKHAGRSTRVLTGKTMFGDDTK